MLRDEFGEHRVVGEQLFAPCFEAAVVRRGLRRMAGDRGEARADRLGIEAAHQAADVLHLAAPRLVALDAFRVAHRLQQIRRERHFAKLRFRKLHQLDAERLQFVHLALAFRLADDLALHRAVS